MLSSRDTDWIKPMTPPTEDTPTILGSSQHPPTPTAQGHEADNLGVPLEQIKILRAFSEGDTDYCYGYSYFETETGYDRKTLKKHMTELREKGIVYYARGLMNEDGEVAGSGFGLTSGQSELMWDLIEKAPDKLEYQLQKDMYDALAYAGFYDYGKRNDAVKKLMRLVAGYTKEKGNDLITEGSSQDKVTPSRPGEHKKQELERGK